MRRRRLAQMILFVYEEISMTRKPSVLLLGLLVLSSLGVAQDPCPQAGGRGTAQQIGRSAKDARDGNVYVGPCASRRRLIQKLVTNMLLDQREIWTSPFRIDRSSALPWIGVGAGTAILLSVDHRLTQALPANGVSSHFGTDASRAGQWYAVFPAAAVLSGLGLAVRNDKVEETGLMGLEAVVDADLVSSVLKFAARRQRPLDGDHGGHFEKGGSSFPSGHSTQAWALATVVASEYGDHAWVPYVSYSYATLVSVSRVLAQAHFSSDVFVGGAIGFFIGRYVVRTQKMHQGHLSSFRDRLFTPSVAPSFSGTEHSIALSWSY